jgi:hypothetical protein
MIALHSKVIIQSLFGDLTNTGHLCLGLVFAILGDSVTENGIFLKKKKKVKSRPWG